MASNPDPSFFAPPGEVRDWRMIVLFDAAAGAGVLDTLPGGADGVAASLGLDPRAVRVVLDALTAWGIVARDGDGRYSLGPDAPTREVAAQWRHHARAIRSWSGTLDRRLRGEPDELRAGLADPELFIDALGATARKGAPVVVDTVLHRFPNARTVLDLGGGHGEHSLEFARRGLHATLQDLPTMVDIVRRRGVLAEAGVELFEGSFFEVLPDGPFDIAFCTGITHTFDAEHNRLLYRRLRPIVTSMGGIAVISFLRHRQPLADVFAVQMLANARGGDTHSEEEYRAWLTDAGFVVDAEPVDLPGRPQSALFAS